MKMKKKINLILTLTMNLSAFYASFLCATHLDHHLYDIFYFWNNLNLFPSEKV